MSAEEQTGHIPVGGSPGPEQPLRLSNRSLPQVLFGCVFSLIAIPAAAQKTTFNPAFNLDLFASNNVDYVGDSGRSDRGLHLGLSLPVERSLKRGSIAFNYNPAITLYGEFTELDNISHLVSLEASTQPSRNSSLSFRAGYSKTQEQGDPRSLDPADLFLDRRTDRERASVDLFYQAQPAERWSWDFSLGASGWLFQEIEDFEEEQPGIPLEDRVEFRGTVGVARTLSPSDSIGLSYGFRFFDLDLSGEETSQSVSLVYQRDIEDRISLGLSLGAFYNTGDATTGAPGSRGGEQSGVQGGLSLTRTFRQSSLSFVAGHAPSAGGARIGTSLNGYVGLSYVSANTRYWNWGLLSRVARRDPSNPEQPTIDSFTASIQIGRNLGRQLGIRLGGDYVYQSSSAEVAADSSYLRGSLGLVWFPLGRSGVMGGGSN